MVEPKRKRRGAFPGPIKTASKALSAIFTIMDDREITTRKMSEMIGKDARRISEHRRGLVEPGILTVEAMAQVLDLKLVLVPIEADNE